MTTTIIIIFIIAISMSMVGKGGGNFYVIALVLTGISMHDAATTSQLIILATALTSMIVFNKHKKVDWKLALIIDPPTDVMAFVGGYFAEFLQVTTLKLVFAIVLVIISIVMFIPVKEKTISPKAKVGYWHRYFNGYDYTVNLWLTLPITAAVGFFAGAVGISGGAFKIPLMVILCGIPMEIAIGTSSAMVAVTALMGFSGHMVNGSINPSFVLPLIVVAIVGGFIGSRFALQSKPKYLKAIFAGTNMLAGLLMIANIYMN